MATSVEPEKEKLGDEEETSHGGPLSRRWILSYVAFLGFVFVYITRINISVAIICMVRTAGSNTTRGDGGGEGNITGSQEGEDGDLIDEACGHLETAVTMTQRGEFDWDKPTRSLILAMYFYGYIFTQIPGGWLAGRFGARRVWGIGMFVNGLGTILTPVCARTHLNLLYACRFIIGFAAGVSFPATHSLWGRWAPPLERSKLMSVCYSGPHVGTIVAFAASGVLCANGFDNGWGSIFYVFGGGNLVWVGLWAVLSADNPRTHRFISKKEIRYIEKKIGYKTDIKTTSTPWLAMAKSGPLWAIIIAHMCNNWTNYTLITVLPTFMKEVLKFDIKQNGSLSSVPYVCHVVLSVIAGQAADTLRARTNLGTTRVRKLFQGVAFLTVAVFLVGTGFVQCENRMVAVALLAAAVGCMGISKGAYIVNHVDIAPKHAGVLFGITNTVATIPGMLAPLVAGALTPNKTVEEWRIVLYICAGFLVFGAVIFSWLASGDTQHWNDHGSLEEDVEANDFKKSLEYIAIHDRDDQHEQDLKKSLEYIAIHDRDDQHEKGGIGEGQPTPGSFGNAEKNDGTVRNEKTADAYVVVVAIADCDEKEKVITTTGKEDKMREGYVAIHDEDIKESEVVDEKDETAADVHDPIPKEEHVVKDGEIILIVKEEDEKDDNTKDETENGDLKDETTNGDSNEEATNGVPKDETTSGVSKDEIIDGNIKDENILGGSSDDVKLETKKKRKESNNSDIRDHADSMEIKGEDEADCKNRDAQDGSDDICDVQNVTIIVDRVENNTEDRRSPKSVSNEDDRNQTANLEMNVNDYTMMSNDDYDVINSRYKTTVDEKLLTLP